MVSTVLKRIDRRVIAVVAVALLLAVTINLVRSPAETKTVTAHFPRAVSVYEGTDVRILGVNVGNVTAVIPEGNSVRVEMEYDASYKIPAKAQAVIVTPTLVADRFVQLTPVFQGGDVMADGADIALPETAVPVELDRIYGSLQALTRALGPNGVNADGTLDHLLQAGTKAFGGQGAQGNQMIQDLADAAQTFGDGAGPLFETVTQLAKFTTTLAQNDTLVRAFMQDLTGVSSMLAEESDELQKAVAAVAKAVGSVKGFVKDNRDAFVADIRKLTEVMTTIASERDNIKTAIEVAPVAMGNLAMGFDHVSDSQNSRFAIGGNVWDVDGLICSFIQQHPSMPPALKDTACELVEKLIEPIATKLPWLPPEYKSSLPKQTASKNDVIVPRVSEVSYSTGDDTSVQTLLGGAS
ncbi:MCE family protein [Nocardioides albidus]|uniref:MCE family protein n=1 Tax=Nocardioides albidus TaxID=1517589 RepID=A0A5C4W7I5_9ACTN|nr:MCE family protein [Nocardioides albidus]TNM43319.1 MCE family protein [Nocardioides albidus]